MRFLETFFPGANPISASVLQNMGGSDGTNGSIGLAHSRYSTDGGSASGKGTGLGGKGLGLVL